MDCPVCKVEGKNHRLRILIGKEYRCNDPELHRFTISRNLSNPEQCILTCLAPIKYQDQTWNVDCPNVED